IPLPSSRFSLTVRRWLEVSPDRSPSISCYANANHPGAIHMINAAGHLLFGSQISRISTFELSGQSYEATRGVVPFSRPYPPSRQRTDTNGTRTELEERALAHCY